MELALAPAKRRARRNRRRIARDDSLVLDTIQEHAHSLLATARRHSLCADDAHDAYQRALEIFLRRAGDLEREQVHNWLHTVVRNEALEVRERRLREVSHCEPLLDGVLAASAEGADESAARFERLAEAADALASLTPHQARALLLVARGYSYEEVASLTGWSATKVNRCVNEGRREFRARLAKAEAGDECRRWSSALAAIADGKADAETVSAVRPHLRACAGCRATLHAYRGAPAAIGALLPTGALEPTGGLEQGSGLLARAWDVVASGFHERAAVSAAKLQLALDGASAYKVAAVAASATAVAGGGAVAVEPAEWAPQRPAVHEDAEVASAPRHRTSGGPGGRASGARSGADPLAAWARPAAVRPRATRRPRRVRVERARATRAPAPSSAGEFGFEPAAAVAATPGTTQASATVSAPTASPTPPAPAAPRAVVPAAPRPQTPRRPSGGEFVP